jgi:hypothetical protein
MTMNRITLAVAAVLIATSVGLSASFAQSDQRATPNTPALRHAPAPDQGMMGGSGMMMGEMTRMTANCNRMMETMQRAPSVPGQPHNG